jgi:hypothetical protein
LYKIRSISPEKKYTLWTEITPSEKFSLVATIKEFVIIKVVTVEAA